MPPESPPAAIPSVPRHSCRGSGRIYGFRLFCLKGVLLSYTIASPRRTKGQEMARRAGFNIPRRQATEATQTSATAGGSRLVATLLRVAWLSVLLGLGMEALLLLFAAGSGLVPELGEIVAASVQKVSWAVIVCTGIALGTTVSSIIRAPLMGILGFLAAPAAFHVARTLHQGTKEALEITGNVASVGTSVFVLALIKGIEYACLGAAVGWVGRRSWGGLLTHILIGLAVGIVFGGTVLAYTYTSAPEPPPTATLISRGIDEVFFPVGCSLVLFSAQALGRWIASEDEEEKEKSS